MASSTEEFLEEYIVQSARLGLKKYVKDDTFSITNLTDVEAFRPDGKSFSEHMSIILLWSSIGSMIFKVHFTLTTAKKLTAKVLETNLTHVSDKSAMDFMREFNNIIGGSLRGDFEKNQILVSMSLPFLTKGEDELVFRNIKDQRARCRIWRLSNGDSEVICSTEICLLEAKSIENVRESLQKLLDARALESVDSSGEIEFL